MFVGLVVFGRSACATADVSRPSDAGREDEPAASDAPPSAAEAATELHDHTARAVVSEWRSIGYDYRFGGLAWARLTVPEA